jgi:signal transduction histidine kinase
MTADAVDKRVQRARRVLGQIIGTLDNALAATTTLAGSKQISVQDADLDLLIGLSLGDLDSTQRWRVEVERLTSARTVTLDFGLLRLALRNLLSNALSFSPPASTVLLRISETEEPLALVFEVLDRGPGLEPDLQHRLFLRGERGRDEHSGHGLGLYVVRRVAEVHGGRVTVQPRDGGGLVFSLVLPQGQAD